MVLFTMPWIRLRHHCRFFFRQFISSDMMIFQEDMVQRKGKRLQRLLPDSRFQLAFPDDDGMPSHFCQPMQHLMVPLPVPPDFILPELDYSISAPHNTCILHVHARSIHSPECRYDTFWAQYPVSRNRGWLSRYLNPLAHKNFLTRISGLVSLPLIAAILLWRCSMVILSGMRFIYYLQEVYLCTVCYKNIAYFWKQIRCISMKSCIHRCKSKERRCHKIPI